MTGRDNTMSSALVLVQDGQTAQLRTLPSGKFDAESVKLVE